MFRTTRSSAVALLLVIAAPLAAQQNPPAPPDTARPSNAGIVAGVVRDERGAPLLGAAVAIRGAPRQARTVAEGRFIIERIPAGNRELTVSMPGYRIAEAMVRVPADSAIEVAITLVAESEAQRLPGVIVEAEISNRIVGLVVDEGDQPVEGAMVALTGARERLVTGPDGRFTFIDVKPGTYVLQVRKVGYAVTQRSMQMVKGIERDVAFRLRTGERDRYTTGRAALASADAEKRQGMAGAQAKFVGRTELEAFGDSPLHIALLASSGGIAFRQTGGSCVVLDGFEVLQAQLGGEVTSPRTPMVGTGMTTGRGPTSINSQGQDRRGTVFQTPRPRPVVARSDLSQGWVSFFLASEVELVEIYPNGAENSRTLCGLFASGSGCSCPPEPPAVVIWLRR